VLSVTALGATVDEARSRAYAGVAAITWPGMQHRTDIALGASSGAIPTTGPASFPTPKAEAAR
jgi:phosphoribosylamine--glycine ligase